MLINGPVKYSQWFVEWVPHVDKKSSKDAKKTAAMPSQENDERRQKEAAAAAAMFTPIWRLQADADSFFHACLYDHKVSHL